MESFEKKVNELENSLTKELDFIEKNPTELPDLGKRYKNLANYYNIRKEAKEKNTTDEKIKKIARMHNKIMHYTLPKIKEEQLGDGTIYNIFNAVVSNGEVNESFNNIFGEDEDSIEIFDELITRDVFIRKIARDLKKKKAKNIFVYEDIDEINRLNVNFGYTYIEKPAFNCTEKLMLDCFIGLNTIERYCELEQYFYEPYSQNLKFC